MRQKHEQRESFNVVSTEGKRFVLVRVAVFTEITNFDSDAIEWQETGQIFRTASGSEVIQDEDDPDAFLIPAFGAVVRRG